jgi:hypothetical protein
MYNNVDDVNTPFRPYQRRRATTSNLANLEVAPNLLEESVEYPTKGSQNGDKKRKKEDENTLKQSQEEERDVYGRKRFIPKSKQNEGLSQLDTIKQKLRSMCVD